MSRIDVGGWRGSSGKARVQYSSGSLISDDSGNNEGVKHMRY